MSSYKVFIIIASLFVMAVPLVAAVYAAMKPGRSVLQAYLATGYVILLCIFWVFFAIWIQMTVVNSWF